MMRQYVCLCTALLISTSVFGEKGTHILQDEEQIQPFSPVTISCISAELIDGASLGAARGDTISSAAFNPQKLSRAMIEQLTPSFDGPIPYYPVTVEPGASTTEIRIVAPGFSGELAAASTRAAKTRSPVALVEEKYWDEFQMLQWYKEIHPQINWTNVPDSMRYKVYTPPNHAAPRPTHSPEFTSEATSEKVQPACRERAQSPESNTTLSRSGTRSNAVSSALSAIVTLLLLNPDYGDDDNDGLPNWWEYHYFGTNTSEAYASNDYSDEDGVLNLDEYLNGTYPTISDTDNDGLTDYQEIYGYPTCPFRADTDGDMLLDGQEVYTYGTSPTNPDHDGDGLRDGAEIYYYGTDPLVANSLDLDGDGIQNAYEVSKGLNPADASNADTDCDDDGYTALEEYLAGTDPTLASEHPPTVSGVITCPGVCAGPFTMVASSTSTGWFGPVTQQVAGAGTYQFPGIPTGQPVWLKVYAGTNLFRSARQGCSINPITLSSQDVANADFVFADSDADGLFDSWEVLFGLSTNNASGNQGADGDPDGDTLTNLEEFQRASSPIIADSLAPTGVVTTLRYTYDEDGRLTSTFDNQTRSTRWTLSPAGNIDQEQQH